MKKPTNKQLPSRRRPLTAATSMIGGIGIGAAAPTNLVIPPHYYEDKNYIIVGGEQESS